MRRLPSNFLGKRDEQRDAMADQVLRGHLRAIVGTMTVSELIEDRNKFSGEVQGQAGTDLSKMGLSIVRSLSMTFVMTKTTSKHWVLKK